MFKIDTWFLPFRKEYCLTADEKKEFESLLPSDKPDDIKKKLKLIQEVIARNEKKEHCFEVSAENILKLQELLKGKDLAIVNKEIQMLYKAFHNELQHEKNPNFKWVFRLLHNFLED